MDLAALSSLLSKKGFGAKNVLETYQKMYEVQVVSYPRTEDKFISPEQFNELLPLVDAIAAVVGVDSAALSTARRARVTSSLVGRTVPTARAPTSLPAWPRGEEIRRAGPGNLRGAGEELFDDAGRGLRVRPAPGHVEKYPTFVGSLNVPAVLGWKGVFVVEDDDTDEPEPASGATTLGKLAEPFVHEGFQARPPHPTMSWLMKQLEKRSVGTGATRTSTYAEVTNNANGKALMTRSAASSPQPARRAQPPHSPGHTHRRPVDHRAGIRADGADRGGHRRGPRLPAVGGGPGASRHREDEGETRADAC
ncbi:hypothetical protein GS491_24090 [Rhodococcus hoagii]|nr:hypothetical protein [Prescottella equi]